MDLRGFEPLAPSMRTTGGAVTEVIGPVHRDPKGSGRSSAVATVAVLVCCTALSLTTTRGGLEPSDAVIAKGATSADYELLPPQCRVVEHSLNSRRIELLDRRSRCSGPLHHLRGRGEYLFE